MIRFDTFTDDHFEPIHIGQEDEEYSWQIDYSKDKGIYRVSLFKNNHWHGEVIFDEVEKA